MYKGAITEEILDDFRLFLTSFSYGDKNSIVPLHQEHKFLFSNFPISKLIREFYFSICSDMISDEEYESFIKRRIMGNRKTFLNPYPLIYNGAFVERSQFHFWLAQTTFRQLKYNGNNIKRFEDMFPILDEYREGFKEGFENFEKECITKFFPMFPDKSDYIQRVFEYLTKNILITGSWKNTSPGFTTNFCNEIINVKDYGVIQGYYYKAWSILLSNHLLFVELFDKQFNHNKNSTIDIENNRINEEIEKIELEIRKIIGEKIDIKTYNETVSQNIRDKVSLRIESHLKKYPVNSNDYYEKVENKLNFFDLMECCEIITNKKNWLLFEEYFKSKSNLTDKFNKLSELRNCLRHSRELNEIILFEGKASIIWFQKILKLND